MASTLVGWDSATGQFLQLPITIASLFCFFTPLVMTVAVEWHNLRGLSEELEHMLEDQKFINPLKMDEKDEDEDEDEDEDQDDRKDKNEDEDTEDSGDDDDKDEVDEESGDTRPEPEPEPDGDESEQDAELGAQPGGDA